MKKPDVLLWAFSSCLHFSHFPPSENGEEGVFRSLFFPKRCLFFPSSYFFNYGLEKKPRRFSVKCFPRACPVIFFEKIIASASFPPSRFFLTSIPSFFPFSFLKKKSHLNCPTYLRHSPPSRDNGDQKRVQHVANCISHGNARGLERLGRDI